MKKILFKAAVVEKKNQLNEMRNNEMTLNEIRLFTLYLSKINHMDQSSRIVKFPLSDFVDILGIKQVNIKSISDCCDSLLQKIVTVPMPNGGFDKFQLFKRCKLLKNENGEWLIELNAHDEALPLMFDFKDKYFKYQIENIIHLKSNNQIRMYELLKQYEKIGKRTFDIKTLRELLGIKNNEYPAFNDFKKRILDDCQAALEKHTDISYTYRCAKRGERGKWLAIEFIIKKKSPPKNDKNTTDKKALPNKSELNLTSDKIEELKNYDLGLDFNFDSNESDCGEDLETFIF